MSTITFTPLPNGGDGDKLRLSVFTTFRLASSTGRFDGLGGDVTSWPSTDVTFEVSINGGDPITATDVTPVERRADLWSSLFGPDAVVDVHEVADDLSRSRFRTIPAAQVENLLKGALTDIAVTHPRGDAPLPQVRERFAPLVYEDEEQRLLALEAVELTIQTTGTTRFTTKQLKSSIKTVANRAARRRVRSGSRARRRELELSIAGALIDRLGSKSSRAFMLATAVIDPRFVREPSVRIDPDFSLNFHEAVAALNGHPFLLRTFGIVRDLEIDYPTRTPRVENLVDVALTASWSPSTVSVESFVTKAMLSKPLSGTVFRAATRDDIVKQTGDLKVINGAHDLPRRLDEGYVKLGDGKWQLTLLDIEHAALEMVGFSADITNAREVPEAGLDAAGEIEALAGGDIVINPGVERRHRTASSADAEIAFVPGSPGHRSVRTPVPPPSPRSNGISLVRDGLEQELQADVKHQVFLDGRRRANSTVFLAAEDVTRGYAVDIWDETDQRWFSLCERTGTFELESLFLAADDRAGEAAVIPSVAGLKDGIDDVVMHPAFVKWTGWSLAASLPGRVIKASGSGQPNIDPPQSNEFPGFPLKATYRPRLGSLPRLRFGRSYRMRLRAIDLAGNVVPLEEARDDATVTIGPIRYLRYDPLLPPYLMFRRSPNVLYPPRWKLKKEAEAVDRLVVRSNFDEPAVAHELPERFVLPPRTAWATAETLGVFDENGTVSPTAYARFVNPLTPGSHKEGALTAELSETDREVFDDPSAPYEFPYLPDAGTRRVMFRGLPGANGALVDHEIDLYPPGIDWPNAQLFVIKLVDDVGAPEEIVEQVGEVTRRVLVVKMPKGVSYTVRYSSVPEDPDVSSALLDDVMSSSSLSGAQKAAFSTLVSRGEVHLYTPARDLILVHAIRQPRSVPSFFEGGWNRSRGSTFAHLRGKIAMHRPSTERVHLIADWTEYLDVEPEGPTTRDGRAIVADTPVGFVNVPDRLLVDAVDLRAPEIASGGLVKRDPRHEFRDTKHRNVTYTPVASSRYAEYFPLHREFVAFADASDEVSLAHDDIDEATVRVVDGGLDSVGTEPTVYERFVDYDIDGAAGTLIHFGRESSIAPGQNLVVSYRRSTKRSGEPRTMSIASSARPAAPKVVYVTPAFKWEPAQAATVTSTTVKSTRHGGILRVWMDRPWYSSGEGERLGVLVLPSGSVTGVQSASLDPYVTRIAGDPLWRAPAPKSSYVRVDDLPASLTRDASWGRRVAMKASCTLAERSGGFKPAVAAFDVAFDDVSKRWYSDVTMQIKQPLGKLDQNYMPFVRLALVRFQEQSLPGVEISPVVIANFVQITPTRSATVFREDGDLVVTVQGNTYQEGPGAHGPALMSFEIQQPMYSGAGKEIEYQTVEDPIVVSPDPHELWPIFATWSARIPVPPAGTDARLVIKEFERYEFLSEERPTTRLVYMDILDIG